MTLKIDASELYTTTCVFEMPKVHSTHKDKILDRFKKESHGDSDQKLSSYRCAKSFKLDFEKSINLAKNFRSKFKRLIVLGTGGSSLGSKAVVDALRPKIDREIFFIENLDATDLPKLNDDELKETALIAISKSGNTLETLVSLQHYTERFTTAGLKISEHFVAISDAESKAPLASWAQENSVPLLKMDPLLGGRWSVTSVVGTFPLAFCGIDTKAFVAGFEKRFEHFPSEDVIELALRFADFDTANLNVHSQWFYSSRLKEIGSWWKQLWSESLGKKKGSNFVGAFACPATGAVDQHSVLQQMTEGRNDAYTGFVFVEKNQNDIEVKKLDPLFAKKIAFAENKSWHQLLQAQGLATRQSLIKSERSTYALHLDQISEESLGDFMAFWMDITALVGAAFEVNPFNQPGVELGKKILPEYI
ncbi:MAG: hypothetical protein R3A80_09530 [Bdellovibrionota bacterium]